MSARALLLAGWIAAIALAAGVRLGNALAGSRMWGYDAWGHVAYVLFLDLYRALPWAHQGWSYFHPPLHYALGWIFAQFGSGDVLMRGLPLLASAASLGSAALAAWLVRVASPERPGLVLLAFSAVALLPVHLALSGMPGNEMTVTFLTAASVTAFIANERREAPRLWGDVLTGVLLGLALLTKYNGLLPLGVVGAALALRPWWAPGGHASRVLARGALILGLAAAMAAPVYARNLRTFGTPVPSSREFPLVESIERDQPPGHRSWRDYVALPLELFADPNPMAPHLLHSVWGSVYLNLWADTHREWDRGRALEVEREKHPAIAWMAVLGLAPTALALAGAVLAARDALRGRRRAVYVPLLLLSLADLAAFVLFTWRVPTWAALKASYCMGLSLPFAVFLARSIEGLTGRPAVWQRLAAPLAVGVALLAASLVATPGLVLPRRGDAPATGAVRFHFGEYDEARRLYARLLEGSAYPVVFWLDNLAAVELADGEPERARRLYARALASGRSLGWPDPHRVGRLAVATALAGDLEGSEELLSEGLADQRLPELLANRGVVRVLRGDASGAENDLRTALASAPELVPAWLNLAALLEPMGRGEEAAAAREGAAREACRTPRGYPYGLGTGEIVEWGVGRRWLLLLEQGALRAATPDFYRRACRRLGA